jgi:pimeloyl-ACP methyl ester carboxylesterase
MTMTTMTTNPPALPAPQLLLIPGLAGDATMWRFQREVLPESLRPEVTQVHALPEATSVQAMAALLLEQYAGPLLLCGASMGGMVAMEAARQAPGRVMGLALLGTTARPETPEMQALRESAIALFEQGRVREVIEPNVAFAFHPVNAARHDLVQDYLDFVLRAGAEQLVRQNRAVIARPDARLHLPQVSCPVLVVCGESDQLTPLACSEEIAELVPGAELEVLADCGHMLTMERPEVVNTLLTQWLQRGGWTA